MASSAARLSMSEEKSVRVIFIIAVVLCALLLIPYLGLQGLFSPRVHSRGRQPISIEELSVSKNKIPDTSRSGVLAEDTPASGAAKFSEIEEMLKN
jgi:hypothetical protein